MSLLTIIAQGGWLMIPIVLFSIVAVVLIVNKYIGQYKIKNNIFSELKQLGWHIATIFGDTGLIIMKSEEHIKKSLWASSFDFNIQ